MKMMENDGENSCVDVNTPAKKRKLKQAQLPFQRSPIGSPSVIQNKKRKLSSPAMDSKSPKAIKISRKSRSMGCKTNDKSDDKSNVHYESVDITDDSDMENLKENATTNKNQSNNKDTTLKQIPKEFQKAVVKISPMSKYLKKSEENVETSKSNEKSELDTNNAASQSNNSIQQTEALKDESNDEFDNESDDESDDKLDNKCDDKLELKAETVISQSCNSNQETEINISINTNNDSCLTIESSDDEHKEESAEELAENMDTSTKNINLSDPKTPTADQLKQETLTPKQQERRMSSAMKKKEKERLKIEMERQREERREIRQKEKEERRKEKEERYKAEREQKMLEKKLREQKKQEEYIQKRKEKQARDDERRKRDEAREEERRKKKEEKLEAERKKQKAASNFTSFFVAKKLKSLEEESTKKVHNFMPFEVKADMKLAPICRRNLSEMEKITLDENQNKEISIAELYLSDLKNKKIVPRKSSRTWPLESKDDIIPLDDDNDDNANIVNQDIIIEKQRTKLLQFKENRRPPYWGTWRKRSEIINPRKPFSKDEKWFNYEIDSDEEWEEEEPGESLHGSDEEKDEENPDDNEYDVDNEFMVPHGYLSNEELRDDEEDKEDMTPETHKFKLKVLGEQFESERNTKTSKLKPKIIGCVWRGLENTFSENVPPKTRDFLSSREAWVHKIPVSLPTNFENDMGAECGTPTDLASRSSRKSIFPPEAIPELIHLVHGNVNSRGFLIREFITYWNKKHESYENQISKSCVMHKIRELGQWMPCPEEGPMHLRPCWYVPKDTRKMFLEEDLPLPNKWSYNLTPKKKRMQMIMDLEEKEEEKEKDKKNVPLITQFTKKITQEEMKKQLTDPGTSNVQNKPAKAPKRAILISVSRGEQIPSTSKTSSLKNFIISEKKVDDTQKCKEDTDDDIVILNESEEEIDKKDTTTPNVLKSERKKKADTKTMTGSTKKIKIKIAKKSANGSVLTSVNVQQIN
ncbi:uncharacterized protein LOC144478252 [Augochlora pura]